jgi:sulfite dehydrogenase
VVEVSTDGGKAWTEAKLGEDLGKYAFRIWRFPLTGKGKVTVMARASNAIGQTQTATLIHNPAGYHHNVIHSLSLNVA